MYHYRYIVQLSLGGMKLGQSIHHSRCNRLNNSGTRELRKACKLFMRACRKLVGEDFNQRIDTFVDFPELFDSCDCVKNRRVVPAIVELPDLGEAPVPYVLPQIDGYVSTETRSRRVARNTTRAEVCCHNLLDSRQRNPPHRDAVNAWH